MTQSSAPIRLEWPGKSSPQAVASAVLEHRRAGHPAHMLIDGDNLLALSALTRRCAGQVTLAYLDPPFFTGRQHDRVERSRDEETGEMVRTHRPAFDDRWDSLHDYLSALRDRLALTRELLTPDGCVVVHVDPKTSHYVKVICDEIFGPRAFASEIVWRYRRWPAKTLNFQRVHDVLLRYVRDPDQAPRFRQLYEPLAPSTLATWGTKKQRAVVGNGGRRVRSSTTEEATPGAPMGDVWDIGIVAPVSRERTGYPTQKPEALLERLIQALSHEDDLVLDPYAGSGTTVAVAARLGRRAIGIDASPEALSVARKRLRAQGIRPLEERVAPVKTPKRARPAAAEPTDDVERLAG
ncbi:MAG: site-specific DNA-methyltransferase [Polyangiaceae bacterium]